MTGGRYRLICDAIMLLVRADGRVLCVRKNAQAEHASSQLTAVGGHLEDGEAVDAAARREAREEAGVDVAPRDQEFVGLAHYNSPQGGGRLGAVFTAQVWSGEVRNAEPDKHEAVVWVDPARPPADCHPYTLAIFEMYRTGALYLSLGWTTEQAGAAR
ncbi:hypothetical protein AQI88_30865 [Streptomyces cellostaticus]|uniref:Nudix hydrolase domain-containing protein n=1 Tax=Streptomyces cellostaticus TaxID=67285 RepID=A0A101NGC1_9ACTN|nr:NUDIX domain-containing protein [Streptomyces cellostaticus]KUM92577.1 hypothetical protein AQI88_30865 [Streptomyces cellostaticus]GHI10466.1 hypothetical protein Scel_87870 [Streptomyces cellostaticus]